MLFNSLEFLIFFSLVFFTYWSLPHWWQNRVLLGASYFFYGSWNWKLLGLIMLTTATDFTMALLIRRSVSPLQRKTCLLAAIIVNLSILGFFKYYNFFVEDVLVFFELLGIPYVPIVLNIVLPVGISFYTFQSMSYTIDVYRGEVEPTTSLIDYALYVSFFPQLVAGPIERAAHLLPQMQNSRRIDFEKFAEGFFLIVLGLFKKVVVADHLSMYVDAEFANQTNVLLLISLYFFAFQIYCDFSGYSDIARGVARLLGFDIRINFNKPYLARSITEFWRRWHISLSTWFKDYVYIPLGGRRLSRAKCYRNLMIAFMLSGLWHGASWTFVIWGAIHGTILIIEKASTGFLTYRHRGEASVLRRIGAVFVTFHIVVLAWVFFRAESLTQALSVFQNLIDPAIYPLSSYMALMHSVVALLDLAVMEFLDHHRDWWKSFPRANGTVLAGTIVFILLWGQMNGGQFIYFQF